MFLTFRTVQNIIVINNNQIYENAIGLKLRSKEKVMMIRFKDTIHKKNVQFSLEVMCNSQLEQYYCYIITTNIKRIW